MMNKTFLVIFLLLFLSTQTQAAEVLKVIKGNKILFSTSGMKRFGPYTVIKVIDGDEEIARAKVTKVGRTKALANLFTTDIPVFKGYQVKIIVYKPPRTKRAGVKKSGTSKEKAPPQKVPRNLAILVGGGFESVGAMKGGESVDPTSFSPYLGLKGEINYRISRHVGVAVSLDYYVGVDGVDMPVQPSFSSGPFKATGTFSDIGLHAQYYLDRFGFYNYYLTGSFMPIVGHKIIKEFAQVKYENAYTGNGLALGAGKEWIFGKWLLQLNGAFKSYGLTSSEDNSGDPARSIAISQTVLNLNLLLGYHF